jgi:transcriptional regulator with XRE-family HTH domain
VAWTEEAEGRRSPEVQRGWDLIGTAVKRRRVALGWSQRDVQRATGIHQTVISRLERGVLTGMRFSKFARLVAAMNGLELERSHPRPPRGYWWERATHE